jgi:hypothetical protein
MQGEAAARQSIEGTAGAPVKGEEAARLAGGRIRDTGALDHGHVEPAAAKVIGRRGTDHASPAYDHAHCHRWAPFIAPGPLSVELTTNRQASR